MSQSASEIANLVQQEMYNPDIIPQLEGYLASQVQQDNSSAPTNSYDFDANRTLVKLYQFFPQDANAENVILAELLALVYGDVNKEGSNDFGALGCLISESFKKDEPYPTLIRCADLLDTCQYENFWSVYQSIGSNASGQNLTVALSTSTHAKNALRKSILGTLSLAFKSTKLSYVMKQLDIHEGDSDSVALLKNESIVEGITESNDTIVFFDNSENTKRNKVNQEGGIDYAMIRGLVLNSKNKVSNE